MIQRALFSWCSSSSLTLTIFHTCLSMGSLALKRGTWWKTTHLSSLHNFWLCVSASAPIYCSEMPLLSQLDKEINLWVKKNIIYILLHTYTNTHTHIHTYKYTYTYMHKPSLILYMYVFICMLVCMYIYFISHVLFFPKSLVCAVSGSWPSQKFWAWPSCHGVWIKLN